MDANLAPTSSSLAVKSEIMESTRRCGMLAGIQPLRAAAPNARFASRYVTTFLTKTAASTILSKYNLI